MSWRPSKLWSLDVLGNVSDNQYNFVPHDRETRFGTMYDARSFKVYFDGQERDAFRTLFGGGNPHTAFLTHGLRGVAMVGVSARENMSITTFKASIGSMR